jgi:hypothetical protein
MNASDGKPRRSQSSVDLVQHLSDLVESTGLDEDSLRVLRDGLNVLAGSTFETVEDEHASVAVLLSACAGDPSGLVEALDNDDDVAVCLELALDALPSSHWALEAALGWAAKPALDRLAVGPAVIELVRNAKAQESTLDDL